MGNKLATLQKIPLFFGLSEASLSRLEALVRERALERDQLVIRQSEPGNSMFVILEGRVKVSLHGDDGKEVILSVLKAGDFFGEMSLLDGQPRSANVSTLEPTRLLVLERSALLQILKHEPEVGLTILAEMSRRLRVADQNIKSLALLDVYGRVARAIRVLCREEGKQAGTNVIIENRPTHQDLAARAGTSRETVSRIVGDLIRAGFITMDAKRLIVHDEFLHETEDHDSL